MRTSAGFIARQGLHQLAQKSTNTYLPCNDESATAVPLVSACENSGALTPLMNLSLSCASIFTAIISSVSCNCFPSFDKRDFTSSGFSALIQLYIFIAYIDSSSFGCWRI